jgi:hypothetical protein
MLISKNHLNLIRKIAWSFYNTTGIDWQELFSEASLAYCEALKNYDPKKGRISTYLWNCIKSHLLNFIKEERKYQTPLDPLNGFEFSDSTFHPFEYAPIFYNEKMVKVAEKAMQSEKATRQILKARYDWSDFVIDQAIVDLKILITLQ